MVAASPTQNFRVHWLSWTRPCPGSHAKCRHWMHTGNQLAERPIQRRIAGADGDRTGEPRIGGGTGIIVIIIHFGRAHSYLRALHC